MEERVGQPVPSEDALWELLGRLLTNPEVAREIDGLQIAGWRPELLYFPDEPMGHMVSPATADAIVKFHKSLQRAYSLLAYGKASALYLKKEDREILNLKVLVTDGSNGFEIAEEAVQIIIEGLLTKMTGDQILITILGFLLLYFSASVARNWISEHYHEKRRKTDSDERASLSAEETKRTEMLTRALEVVSQNRPELGLLTDESDTGKMAIIKGASSAPHARAVGADVTREQARVILSKPRRRGEGKRIEGEFEVIEMDNEPVEGYTGKVRSHDSEQEFEVEINYDDLTDDDLDALVYSLKEKEPILLHANAWFIEEQITRATIMRASKIDE